MQVSFPSISWPVLKRSVAATKSFVSSAVAGLALIGHWTEDKQLLAAIDALPAALEKAGRVRLVALRQRFEG